MPPRCLNPPEHTQLYLYVHVMHNTCTTRGPGSMYQCLPGWQMHTIKSKMLIWTILPA
jgi:hypothetical protein